MDAGTDRIRRRVPGTRVGRLRSQAVLSWAVSSSAQWRMITEVWLWVSDGPPRTSRGNTLRKLDDLEQNRNEK